MPQDEQVLKIFDVNLRQHYYDCAMVEASLAYCNVLKINDEELPVIADMMGVDGGDDEAHVTAVRVAAHVCTQHGAMPAIPDVLKH